MASIEKIYIESALKALVQGKFTVETRTMVSLESNHEIFDGIPFALNDFTLHKRDTSSMITIKVYVDGEFPECILGGWDSLCPHLPGLLDTL